MHQPADQYGIEISETYRQCKFAAGPPRQPRTQLALCRPFCTHLPPRAILRATEQAEAVRQSLSSLGLPGRSLVDLEGWKVDRRWLQNFGPTRGQSGGPGMSVVVLNTLHGPKDSPRLV